MVNKINPEALKHRREALGLTQEHLAELCKCSKDTVSRWERGYTARLHSRHRKGLEKALGIAWEELTKPPARPSEVRDDLVQVSARVRPETRNALQAVCVRYGIDQRIVFEYAPLLFTIAAEQSLIARRQLVNELESAIWEGYVSIREQVPYLGNYGPNIDAEDSINEERESIRRKDLFRKGCGYYDEDHHDPLVFDLKKRAANLPEGAIECLEPTLAGYPDYVVASDTVVEALKLDTSPDCKGTNAILGLVSAGTVELRQAISQRAKLSETEFVDWLEAEKAKSKSKLSKDVLVLLDAVSLGVIDRGDLLQALKVRTAEDGA